MCSISLIFKIETLFLNLNRKWQIQIRRRISMERAKMGKWLGRRPRRRSHKLERGDLILESTRFTKEPGGSMMGSKRERARGRCTM